MPLAPVSDDDAHGLGPGATTQLTVTNAAWLRLVKSLCR
jgi:hypothetical protein